MLACCLKCVYDQACLPGAERREEFPLCLGSLSDHRSSGRVPEDPVGTISQQKARPPLLCWPRPRRFPY